MENIITYITFWIPDSIKSYIESAPIKVIGVVFIVLCFVKITNQAIKKVKNNKREK